MNTQRKHSILAELDLSAACNSVGKLAGAYEELREAVRPFLAPHSGLCLPIVEGILRTDIPVTPDSCKCSAKNKRLRDALGAWE